MTFKKGQLIQVYQNNLAGTLSMAKKIQPMWTGPWRVVEQSLNSYKLETLEGELLRGDYSARRLRGFILREGTELAAQQEAFKTILREESQVMGDDEGLELTSRSDEPWGSRQRGGGYGDRPGRRGVGGRRIRAIEGKQKLG